MKDVISKIRGGFKFLGIFLALIAILIMCTSKAQSFQNHNWEAKIEATNFDERNLVANLRFTTMTTLINLGVQSTGKSIFNLDMGPIVSRKTEDDLKLSLGPGVAFDWAEKQFLYSVLLRFAKEEEKVEFALEARAMKNLNGKKRQKVNAEGEFLMGHRLKIGINLLVEIEKSTGEFMSFVKKQYNDLMALSVHFKWSPKKLDFLYFLVTTGWKYKNFKGVAIGYPFYIDPVTEDGFVAAVAVAVRF
jgi:hypothetical protein